MSVPAKVAARVATGIRRFQPVLTAAKARDVNESDTVVIVMDMLQEIFGYDKYSDITSEYAIKGTDCDLAITLEGALQLLIEVKAIGLDLKESHVKQAVDQIPVDVVVLPRTANAGGQAGRVATASINMEEQRERRCSLVDVTWPS